MHEHLKLIQEFATIMMGETVSIWENPDGWCCFTFNRHCTIGYDPADINAENDPYFRKACHIINPETDKVLDITLTIAHELGHWATRKKYNQNKELKKYKLAADEATPEEYPFLEAERAATEWGIAWIMAHPTFVSEFEDKWRQL